MPDLMGVGTNRGYSMIGLGLGFGVSEFRLPVSGLIPTIDWDWSGARALGYGVGPTVTFSRASTGQARDSSGYWGSNAIDAARFDYAYSGGAWVSRGLLIEEQRTNDLTYSADFTNAAWTKDATTITANATTGPRGANTASKIVETAAAGFHSVNRGTVSFTGSRCVSVYLKAAERTYAAVEIKDGFRAVINLTTGAVTSNTLASSTITVEDAGNGWWWVKYYYSSTVDRFIIYTMNSSTFASYTGDGSSGIYADAEEVTTVTSDTIKGSYIPTTSVSVTRSADVAVVTGAAFSGFWNATQGTFIVEGVSNGSGTRTLLAIDDNTANEQLRIYTSGTDPKFTVTDGGVTQADLDAGTITAGTAFKFACSYKLNSFKACLNGGTVQSDVSGTLPTPDRLRIGVDQAGNYLNGTISRVRYFNSQLTDAQMQALST